MIVGAKRYRLGPLEIETEHSAQTLGAAAQAQGWPLASAAVFLAARWELDILNEQIAELQRRVAELEQTTALDRIEGEP